MLSGKLGFMPALGRVACPRAGMPTLAGRTRHLGIGGQMWDWKKMERWPSGEDKAHVRGERSAPLLEVPIGRFFLEAAEAHGEREFLVDREAGLRRSWRELAAECVAAAATLRRLGFEPGDRLGVWLPNCHEWVVTQYACHLAGLVLVNVNPAYRAGELAYALELVGCRGLVAQPRLKTSDYGEILRDARLLDVAQGLPSLRHVFGVCRDGEGLPGATHSFDELTAVVPSAEEEAAVRAAAAAPAPTDVANIQFTSGTTGSPKATTLTHRGILNNARFVGAALDYGAADRGHETVCVSVPLYHCFGCVMGSLSCVVHGSTLVLPSASFEAEATLQAVQEESCTSLYGVPTMFNAMLSLMGGGASQAGGGQGGGEYALGAQLRKGIMAGSPCPPDLMTAVMSVMGMSEVSICYGMTETSPVSFQTVAGTPAALRCETVGTIHPHVECKVVGEAGETLATGAPGEMCTRGYSIFAGYFGQPEATSECLDEEGWMHTGDLATIDAEGYCRIVGRKKDMLIRGGENLFPTEIENFLRTHPAVHEVAVVGAPHPTLGEEAVAFIIVDPAAAAAATGEAAAVCEWADDAEASREVAAWCRGKISAHKIPARVVLIDEMPLTVSGKITKFELRKLLGVAS